MYSGTVVKYGASFTDEYYLSSGFFHSPWDIDFATVPRPREVGLELEIKFEDWN